MPVRVQADLRKLPHSNLPHACPFRISIATMIVRSPEPPIEVPDVALTPLLLETADAAGRQAGADRRRRAVARSPTGSSAERVQRRRPAWRARGFRKGDVFAIFCPNLPEYALAFHGVALARRHVTTINPLSPREELATSSRRRRAVPPHHARVPRQALRGRARRAASRRSSSSARRRVPTPFASLLGPATPPPDVDDRPARGRRRAAVLERHDRPAEGRDAHPPQPRRERPAVGRRRIGVGRGRRACSASCRSSTSTA